MNDLTGHITKGYELQERIGVGGFGAVFRAFQSSVGREVAIKVILPEYANQPEFIRRFESEAQLVARLEHPFIVPLFDFWREPDGAYLVMRYFRSGSLRETLRQRQLETDEVSRLVDQIAGALSVAHRNGVVHRDLKPDNILLDEDQNAYLTDFGIAKETFVGEEDDEEGISGSPGYMSPEQITSQPVSPQTDIYSLGVMLFEILTGTHPFDNSSPTELILKHLQQPLPPIDLTRVDLPHEVNEIIQRATAKEPSDRYPDVMTLAQEFQRAVSSSDELVIAPIPDNVELINPYKGLRAFEEADAADFFGREALIQQLLNRLRESGSMSRFLAVIGPSGSGKSSVVKAGLLPALRWGDVDGSEQWFLAEMVPGTTPIEKLEQALLSVSVNPGDGLLEQLRRDANGLLRAADRVLPEGSELLLVIDQFEEVFTLLESEAERTQFLSLIYNAVMGQNSRIRVIVTLRADFYDRPLFYENIGTLIRHRTEVVLPLSSEELEKAITGPAQRVDLEVDANLVASIIADVREEPGALPLLQYVLTELYERREGRKMTLAAYQQSGGALGALARRAEELFTELSEKHQQIARQLFLRLVTLGEGTEDTRRRVQWAELMAFGMSRDDLQHVLDAFGRYRLLSFDRDSQTREPTVEVAHEALIREWKRLKSWLDTSRQDVRLQRSLATAAAEWQNSGKDVSFVLRGSRLAQYQEWVDETDLILTNEERDFLEASIIQHQKREAEEAERLAHEAELERLSRVRLRVLVAVLATAFVGALILSVFAFNQSQVASSERDNAQTQVAIAATSAFRAQQQEAIAQREAAISRSLALSASARQVDLSGNHRLALALAVEANSVENPPEQVQRVLANIAYAPGMVRQLVGEGEIAHTASVASAVFSPDGQRILSGSDDSNLILWNANTGEAIRAFEDHSLLVTSVAFSPDGTQAVSGSWDNSLIVWNLDPASIILQLSGHRGVVNTVAFTPDGEQIISTSTDGIILWNANTGELLHQLQLTIRDFAVDPNGEFVLVASDTNSILQIDLDSNATLQQLRGHSSDVLSVAISPDGTQAVSSSRDNSVILWDLESGTQDRRFDDGHTLPVNAVDFSPDGTRIATGSEDNRLVIWDVATGNIVRSFEGEAPIRSVDFSPDGNLALVGLDDGTLTVWAIEDSSIVRTFGTHDGGVNDATYSPDGTQFVSGSNDNTMILWDVLTGEQLATFSGHEDSVNAVDFRPSGSAVASGGDDNIIRIWDVEQGTELLTLSGHEDAINAVMYHPTQDTLFSASDDAQMILWDAESGEEIRRFEGHDRQILALDVNADGTQAITGGADRVVLLWNVESGEMLRQFEGHDSRILDVAFNPDNITAASSSADGFIILWNLETGRQIMQLGSADEDASITSIDFDETGEILIAGDENGRVTLWDIQTGQSVTTFTLIEETVGSGVESIEFSPDGDTALTSMRDGRILQWRTLSLDELLAWTVNNRALADFTCADRELFDLEVQCDEEGNLPSTS